MVPQNPIIVELKVTTTSYIPSFSSEAAQTYCSETKAFEHPKRSSVVQLQVTGLLANKIMVLPAQLPYFCSALVIDDALCSTTSHFNQESSSSFS